MFILIVSVYFLLLPVCWTDYGCLEQNNYCWSLHYNSDALHVLTGFQGYRELEWLLWEYGDIHRAARLASLQEDWRSVNSTFMVFAFLCFPALTLPLSKIFLIYILYQGLFPATLCCICFIISLVRFAFFIEKVQMLLKLLAQVSQMRYCWEYSFLIQKRSFCLFF